MNIFMIKAKGQLTSKIHFKDFAPEKHYRSARTMIEIGKHDSVF